MKICLSLKELAEALSLSRATVRKLVREKTLPEPRLLSGRRVGWLVHEVRMWAETARLLICYHRRIRGLEDGRGAEMLGEKFGRRYGCGSVPHRRHGRAGSLQMTANIVLTLSVFIWQFIRVPT
ncbi:helix-turn-helix transcriptional regulator [Burkholderia latens]|uniref:helix-turn-helix transcriptional regulator n=1 Tax=Burkholderia latens TaxID=488446 RepID=UPI001FC88D88|nr:AlpA family phage regulatory protein [Burkholderia latens]